MGDGGRALLTTPAAAKIYRSLRDPSVEQYHLKIAAGGTLEWLPQETILFVHCQALTTTRVEVKQGTAFIGWEILCLARGAVALPDRYTAIAPAPNRARDCRADRLDLAKTRRPARPGQSANRLRN